MQLESNALSGMFAVAYDWTPNFSLLVQYNFHEGVINNFGKLSNYSHEIVVGFKWMTDHGGMVELGVIGWLLKHPGRPSCRAGCRCNGVAGVGLACADIGVCYQADFIVCFTLQRHFDSDRIDMFTIKDKIHTYSLISKNSFANRS